ncbi:rhodanese-like domain-containing protein [Demequina iriomotensis]|uniref:rhodanese-like domain-containing protein n=1 Tax=Demequina iriomotensis TaxID=1536641 RepID=UPI0009E292E6|nr:rhodanese-like domain-containing protein [Demequina iriomotensis]
MVSIRRGALAALALILASTLAACSPAESGPVAFDGSHVSSTRFADAVAVDGVVVIDVRTPAEYAEGHLPDAVNIDVSDAGFDAAIAELDPAGDYAVYCRSGSRSRAAVDRMAAAGVERTVGLEGGIGAWAGDVVVG